MKMLKICPTYKEKKIIYYEKKKQVILIVYQMYKAPATFFSFLRTQSHKKVTAMREPEISQYFYVDL